MKDNILQNLNNSRQLEKLYREDKPGFKRTFQALYPELKNSPVADFWKERLDYQNEEISWGTRGDLLFVLVASLLAGLVAKLPAILSLTEDYFYPRNVGFIIFPFLTAFFVWKNKIPRKHIAFIGAAILFSVIFINSLPVAEGSDTLILSCIHLLLFLWSLLGFAYVGGNLKNHSRRLDFLRFNGDLLVMTALLVIAGVILTGITFGLFSLIGLQIEKFYAEYIAVFGLPAIPLVATYLTQTNPQLVNKISPVIARIFSPLVLVMLVIYLVAIIYSGKNPYHDREFLLIFNALLIGVMAIIFFSVAESSDKTLNQTETLILFLLAAVTVVVNGIALSAILFRISEWGITPNRLAVMGGNILILINLLWVTARLWRVLIKKATNAEVGECIAFFLPVYLLWTIVVTFLFPLLFRFA